MNFYNEAQAYAYANPILTPEQALSDNYFRPIMGDDSFTLWAGLTINR